MMIRHRKLLAITLIGMATFGHAFALAYTAPHFPAPMIPGSLVSGTRIMSTDFNGDGLPDLAVVDGLGSGDQTGGVWVYLAQKGGGYALPKFYPTGTESLASDPVNFATGDLNGDGSPDIVTSSLGSSAEIISVLINNGNGTFQKPKTFDPDFSMAFDATSIAVGDVNGDGMADVVIGTNSLQDTGNALYVIPGNGDGTLDVSKEEKIAVGSDFGVPSITIADINGDGEPDIVAGNGCFGSNIVDVFLNEGGGVFPTTPGQSISVGECPMLAAGDLNGDGKIDIAVADRYNGNVRLLLNRNGTLVDSGTTYELPAGSIPNYIDVADVDNDGHPDVIVPDYDGSEQTPVGSQAVSILYGLGNGTLANPVQIQAGHTPIDVTIVDARHNGLPDLVVLDGPYPFGEGGPVDLTIIRNLGSRHFLSYSSYTYQGGGMGTDMVSADLNNDGKPDIVLATRGGLSVLMNKGNGRFSAPNVISLNGSATSSVAVGDVNSDGIPDLVAASPYDLYIFLGNGDGNFQQPITITFSSGNQITGLALGDLNGDGKADLVVADIADHAVQSCRSDGTGHFDCSAFPSISFTSSLPYRIKLADLNGDGELDLVVSSDQYDNQSSNFTDDFVFLGNGSGGFGNTPSAIIPVPRGPEVNVVGSGNDGGWGIAVGDINGDGKPDLVIGSGSDMITVALGNGDGTFASPSYYRSGVTTISAPQYVALSDVNGDGYPDIIAANFNDACISVLLNNGDGTFQLPVNYASGFDVFPVLALDLNGDGKTDIVAANLGLWGADGDVISVYLNSKVWQQDQSPVANNGTLTTKENEAASGTLQASIPNNDLLNFAIVAKPAHGTVKLTNATTGAYTYTPDKDYSGSDSFTFKASDGKADSNVATISITIKAASTPPPKKPPSSGGGGAFGWLGLLALAGMIGAMAVIRRCCTDSSNGGVSPWISCTRVIDLPLITAVCLALTAWGSSLHYSRGRLAPPNK